MKTIYLIRHGECISNHENIFIGNSQDPPLTRAGNQQVIELTKALKGMKASAIISSTSLRAKQTAAIISESLCQPFTTSEALMELDLGVLDNKDIGNPSYLSMYKDMVNNWETGYGEVSIFGGESLIDVNDRLLSFMETNILNKGKDEPTQSENHPDCVEIRHGSIPSVVVGSSRSFQIRVQLRSGPRKIATQFIKYKAPRMNSLSPLCSRGEKSRPFRQGSRPPKTAFVSPIRSIRFFPT